MSDRKSGTKGLKSQIVISNAVIPPERIERRILLIRGQKVMLSSDLAELYEVPPGVLNRAVQRNKSRFPADFMFQLTDEEHEDLKCQIGISSSWGGRRHPPFAFTEQGMAMLSCVLRSPRAVQVNIGIMRAFVKLREILSSHRDLAFRLDEMESKYDKHFKAVFDAIRELMRPPEKPKAKIGFRPLPDERCQGSEAYANCVIKNANCILRRPPRFDREAQKPVNYFSLARPACRRVVRRSLLSSNTGLERNAARKFPPNFWFLSTFARARAALEGLCTRFYAPVASSTVSLLATL